MKKIAKISLVAAIAVAGLTTANAQPLEEAIKNVDVSGSVVYRFNDTKNNVSGTSASNNNYKVGTNLSSKVNEDVKFNSRFLVGSTTDSSGNFAGPLDTEANDANVDVELSQANFAYTGVKNSTVTVGKQGLATPYTVATQIDDNEQTGTGILALSTVGPVTLGGAYFNQTNLNVGDPRLSTVGLTGGENIGAVAAIATLGPVTADAWFVQLEDTFKTWTLGAKSDLKIANVALGADARYTSLKRDDIDDKNTLAKVALTAKSGIVNGKVAYAVSGEDDLGLTALDSDAATQLKGWYLNTLMRTDAKYLQLVAGVDILPSLNLSANYGNLKSGNDREEKETYGQLTYKMTKNFSTYARYGKNTDDKDTATSTDDVDQTASRLQVAYTF